MAINDKFGGEGTDEALKNATAKLRDYIGDTQYAADAHEMAGESTAWNWDEDGDEPDVQTDDLAL